MNKLNKENLEFVGFAFLISLTLSWLPLLFYKVVSSVIFFLPDISWAQMTFLCWVAISAFGVFEEEIMAKVNKYF